MKISVMGIETMPIIITPDAIRDRLARLIIQDLINQTGIKIVWEKLCQIDDEAVRQIYPNLIKSSIFDSVVRNLTFGPSLFLIVKGENIYNRVRETKGKSKIINGQLMVSGLRLKYKAHLVGELKALGYRGKRLLDRIVEFRLHAPDNLEEATAICLAYLTSEELDEIGKYAPGFYVEIIRNNNSKKQ